MEVKNPDVEWYENHLKEFLPERIIDVHTHVYLDRFRVKNRGAHNVSWPDRVSVENSISDLTETYEKMFPGKEVVPLIFGNLTHKADDFEAGNRYVRECAREKGYPALYFCRPEETSGVLEEKLTTEGFSGVKVYLSLADEKIPVDEITIFDFLPQRHLEVLNRHHAVVMLHIPRSGRLKDPVNLEQMIYIEQHYPHVKLIIAHVGRAYCKEDLGRAFEVLSSTQRMMFDISANTNEFVFTELIRAVGPKRILFGSDLPITKMRMRRVCEKGRYVNIVPPGLYGDVSDDPHMREAEGEEGEKQKLTFFLYEEIAAFKRAAETTNLSREEIEDVFYRNAQSILL